MSSTTDNSQKDLWFYFFWSQYFMPLTAVGRYSDTLFSYVTCGLSLSLLLHPTILHPVKPHNPFVPPIVSKPCMDESYLTLCHAWIITQHNESFTDDAHLTMHYSKLSHLPISYTEMSLTSRCTKRMNLMWHFTAHRWNSLHNAS